jgi:hypothetical protein
VRVNARRLIGGVFVVAGVSGHSTPAERGWIKRLTAKAAKTAKEQRILTAKAAKTAKTAKTAKENKSFTAKDANPRRKGKASLRGPQRPQRITNKNCESHYARHRVTASPP